MTYENHTKLMNVIKEYIDKRHVPCYRIITDELKRMIKNGSLDCLEEAKPSHSVNIKMDGYDEISISGFLPIYNCDLKIIPVKFDNEKCINAYKTILNDTKMLSLLPSIFLSFSINEIKKTYPNIRPFLDLISEERQEKKEQLHESWLKTYNEIVDLFKEKGRG